MLELSVEKASGLRGGGRGMACGVNEQQFTSLRQTAIVKFAFVFLKK